jgi:hypothetical protein
VELIERVTFGDSGFQEFILLSENTYMENTFMQTQPVGNCYSRRYNAMMVTWHDGTAECAGLGQVTVDGLASGRLKWKEVLLG